MSIAGANSRFMLSTQLLSELETLPYSERQKLVVELGRDIANASLFDELERGATSYERRLALQSCATSRDGERVLRSLFDSSRLVRGLALRLLPVATTDEQVLRASSQFSLKSVRRLLVGLRKQKRQGAIDAVMRQRFAERPDEAAQSLVGFASLEMAEQLLGDEFERASEQDFRRLANLHPRLALEHALQLVRALSAPDGVVLKKANAVLEQAFSFRTEDERELALQLVRELNRIYPLGGLQLNALLLSGSAQQLAEMVIASDETVPLPWSERARRISAPTLVALVQSQNRVISNWAGVLKQLPHSTRAALYEQFNASWRDKQGIIPVAVLALLPRELRHNEARRHLQIANLKAAPANWLPYLSLLPADEATEDVRPFLGDPDPTYRAAALSAIVSNARFEQANIGAVLDLLQKRGNEQDPVRMAMLSALAALPPSLFKEEHLTALARIQRQALDARDLSYGTSACLERLVVALLPTFPEWAGVQIAELLKERGSVSFYNLQDRITDDQMRAIGPHLEPLFRSWTAREHAPFLGAMRALGRRLKVWDAGVRLLTNFVRNGPNSQLPAAAQILAEFRPDIWREVAPGLLAQDESWALQPVMSNFLATKRQDLLSPAILGRRRLQGRFASGKTRQLLPFSGNFWMWTPTQQALFSQTLEEVLHDLSRDSPGAIYAIDRLCQLPDTPPTALLEQAQLSSPYPAWREAALRVLSRLDGGQGVATLLEALDDERARIAIYGLRRALMEMPAPRALEILRTVPMQKVTVAKEVMRLLGDLDSPEAFDFLLEVGERDLHRDVRVALLRALWEHLEDPRSWVILEAAAQSDDPAIATMAARTTHPRLSTATRTRLNALLAGLLRHSDARVRMQVLQNGAVGDISDPQNQLLEPLLACLDSKVEAEYTTAASALWTTYGNAQTDTLQRAVAGAIERLLPRRRALGQVLSTLEWQISFSRSHLSELAQMVLEALARDEAALAVRLKFALMALEPEQFAVLVEETVAQGHLYESAFFSLCFSIEVPDARSYRVRMETTFERWQNASSPLLRRLALAILKREAASASGWTTERRALLEEFRRDPSLIIASVAQFTFWPGEEE